MRFGLKKISYGALLATALSVWSLLISSALASQAVSPEALVKAIEEKRGSVEEFRVLADLAEKEGFRLFLTGGSAAALGDFVKHQMLADEGRMKIAPERLKAELNNVMMPDQDLDLAITRADGSKETPDDVKRFRAIVESTFPRTLANGKSRWDVLGMHTDLPAEPGRAPRIALMNNPDFTLQNNDTLSIGRIELTTPSEGEAIVQDFLGGSGSKSVFLEDVAGTRVRFLESASHSQTARALSGMNPPILSVIRTLSKALQFQKEISSEDYAKLKKIVTDFKPKSIVAGSYTANWIEGKGRVLVVNAYDPEYALNLVDRIGLKSKLIALDRKGIDAPGSLSWWLSKSALPANRSAGNDQKPGLTAQELGISRVVHETAETEHRLLTWRYDDKPRALLSRRLTAGETAHHGDGFYTAKEGAGSHWLKKKLGIEVLFEVDPSARQGVDFDIVGDHASGVLWRNASALKIVQSDVAYGQQLGCATAARQALVKILTSRKASFVFLGAVVPPFLYFYPPPAFKTSEKPQDQTQTEKNYDAQMADSLRKNYQIQSVDDAKTIAQKVLAGDPNENAVRQIKAYLIKDSDADLELMEAASSRFSAGRLSLRSFSAAMEPKFKKDHGWRDRKKIEAAWKNSIPALIATRPNPAEIRKLKESIFTDASDLIFIEGLLGSVYGLDSFIELMQPRGDTSYLTQHKKILEKNREVFLRNRISDRDICQLSKRLEAESVYSVTLHNQFKKVFTPSEYPSGKTCDGR